MVAKALRTKEANFSNLEDWITNLYEEFQVPDRLAKLGVSNEDVPKIVVRTMNDICLATNPKPISKIEMEGFVSNII